VKVRILGCYGSITPYHRTTSFLVNDSLLLDAGTISEALGRDEAGKITHVLLSHAHLEHVKGLLPLAEDRVLDGQKRIVLGAIEPVLRVISQHLFNDEIWPDFTRRPSRDAPVVSLMPLQTEERLLFDGVEVRPIEVSHSVACTGFCVKEGAKGFMFTGDTGTTKRFWEIARDEDGIEFILADVSFPNSMEEIAVKAGHMTPAMLLRCLDAHDLGDKKVYVTHIKPLFLDEVAREVAGAKRETIKLLEQGSTLAL
jgi:ribonuclease BN (tRNA processing enzyme)